MPYQADMVLVFSLTFSELFALLSSADEVKWMASNYVVGISALCMLALLPDPSSSLLSDHVDAALLRESA